MKWFKSGNVFCGVKEIGLTNDNRMQIEFIIKYNNRVFYTSNDLKSGSGMYKGLEQMAEDAIGFMVEGDFLSEENRSILESNVDYEENGYYLEEI